MAERSKPSASSTIRTPKATTGKDASAKAPGARPAAGRQAPAKRAAPLGLAVDVRDTVALVTLMRPEVHNAFDAALIADLTDTLRTLDGDADVRAVVLLAEGRSFCAGADLEWMRAMAGYDHAANVDDARALATLLATLANLSKPTIARVHGPAFGGGVGLVACCDIAVASLDATFALSEVKLGLVPATISPYVIEAIGARQARRYFLTGERFTAAEAFRIGLVHDLAPMDELDARINGILGALLAAGPAAQAEAKALVRAVAHRAIDDAVIEDTAQRIASVRVSPEGREGIAAFLGKRKPAWTPREPDAS